MNSARIFNVAGHRFGLILPDGADEDRVLRPYLPFETDDSVEPLFMLGVENGRSGRGSYTYTDRIPSYDTVHCCHYIV